MSKNTTFETTYRHYPFPMLVTFGLALGRLFVRVRDKERPAPGARVRAAR